MDDKILIDTDILIDFLRKDKHAIDLIEGISTRHLITTDINAFELYHGAYKSNNVQANIAEVKILLDSLEIISTDIKSMIKAAELATDLEKKGTTIDNADLFIASMGIVHSASILTRNKKHFERLGVKILD